MTPPGRPGGAPTDVEAASPTLELDVRLALDGFVLAPRLSTASRRIALFGASGSGKSLTLEVIAGLRRPRAGFVRVRGETFFDAAQRRDVSPQARRIGYVPQHYLLFPHLSAAANVAYGLRRRDPRRVPELLELVGLRDHARKRPRELSGGEQQRVAFARALAGEPRLLLLDEPFSALDEVVRAQLRRALAELLEVVRTPTLLVTHDLVEATMLADTIVVLHQGAVVQAGSGDDLMLRPANTYVADLVGMTNRLEVTVVTRGAASSWVRWHDQTLEVAGDVGPVGSAATLGIRPEQLWPEAAGQGAGWEAGARRDAAPRGPGANRGSTAPQTVGTTVERVTRQGLESLVRLRTDAGAPLEMLWSDRDARGAAGFGGFGGGADQRGAGDLGNPRGARDVGLGGGPEGGAGAVPVAAGDRLRVRLEPRHLWPLRPPAEEIG